MKTSSRPFSMRCAGALSALLLSTLVPFGASEAQAQDAASIGAGRKPFVVILLDSSASMEQTSEGSGYFPYFDNNNPNNDDRNNESKLNRWNPGAYINQGDSSKYDNEPDGGPVLLGSCYAWRPTCGNYERPSWKPESDLHDGAWSHYSGRLSKMQGSTSRNAAGQINDISVNKSDDRFRRLPNSNQPRHVQFKEILTGDMILKPRVSGADLSQAEIDSLNPDLYGPGCWFVPRFHGAKINADADDLCFDTTAKKWKSSHRNSFQSFVDYNEVRPHYQEVFDHQLETGLMDILSDQVVFSVAMFDGYSGELEGGQVTTKHFSGARAATFPNDGTSNQLPGHPYGSEESNGQYNIGIFKIVGPTTFENTESVAGRITAFSQLAVVDAGYLHNSSGAGASHWKVDPSEVNKTHAFNVDVAGMQDVLPVYYSGQQPLAGDTPIAAAMYDIHNYFINGQRSFDFEGKAVGASSNPIQDDRYKECRPKHVVIMTDGKPSPEIITDANNVTRLSGYGYKEGLTGAGVQNRYAYGTAEDEINSFVSDATLNPASDTRYQPYVHVVGLSFLNDDQVTRDENTAIKKKLGEMAYKGNTCAEHWLKQTEEGRGFLPSSMGGTCDENTDNCLVPQLDSPRPFALLDGTTVPCIAPAVLLSSNDKCTAENPDDRQCTRGVSDYSSRDDMTFVLSLIFNQIISAAGGISSRTRPAITSRLDSDQLLGQHRIFSGALVDPGDRHWAGLLNRQPLTCRNDNSTEFDEGTVVALHEEISKQVVRQGNDYLDNRRIFTSVRKTGANSTTLPDAADAGSTNPVIISSYALQQVAPDDDAFKLTSLAYNGIASADSTIDTTDVLGTRVPFFGPFIGQAKNGGGGILGGVLTNLLGTIFNTSSRDQSDRVVNAVRGRELGRLNKTLGAIVYSNPVVVGPPTRDLPIDSYRAFKEKFENRPTMLYVSTRDGLLHAIYTGDLSGQDPRNYSLRVSRRALSVDQGADVAAQEGVTVGASSQREAWAYAPEMLHNQYRYMLDKPANLMDGSPVVSDVRLCHANDSLNQNAQACKALDGGSGIPPADQWRSVLVTGLGPAGAGYFALDVTRTGRDGLTPDPITLWEFDPQWEVAQIKALSGAKSRYSSTVGLQAQNANGCGPEPTVDEFDVQSFMGNSVGDPEIATISLRLKSNVGQLSGIVQRPVAIFTGGKPFDSQTSSDCYVKQRNGRAIYIVDLQTGSLLKRFVSYFDDGTPKRFETSLESSPLAYNNVPGSVASRAFVGDNYGRMMRLNLSSANPDDWTVDLMYDPCRDNELLSALPGSIDAGGCSLARRDSLDYPFGPSTFKPAAALNKERQVILTYGLGISSAVPTPRNTLQAVLALSEDRSVNVASLATPDAVSISSNATDSVIWRYVLAPLERLTGEPMIFNNSAHFTTYLENAADPCAGGTSRIYGLNFEGKRDANGDLTGDTFGSFSLKALGFAACPNTGATGVICGGDGGTGFAQWVGPEDPSLIRGVALTLGPVCSVNVDANGPNFNEEADVQPTLVATTGGSTPVGDPAFGGGSPDGMSGNNDLLSRFQVRVQKPRSKMLPLSYVSLGD